MFKKNILCCILSIIIGEPSIGQHETNETSEVFFDGEGLTAVSKFYWQFSDYPQARSVIFETEIVTIIIINVLYNKLIFLINLIILLSHLYSFIYLI